MTTTHARSRFARLGAAALLGLGLFLASPAAEAQATPDTVHLQGGGRVRGTVIVDDSKGVQVLLPDQTTRQYDKADVVRVEYGPAEEDEAPSAPAPAPAPEPPPAAAPAAPPIAMTPSFGPAPEQPQTESIKGLWVAGMVVLGISWLGSIPAAAAISSATGSEVPEQHAGVMAAPLVGPWLEAAGVIDAETTVAAPAFAAIGVLQLGGTLMTILGLTLRRPTGVAEAEQLPTFAVAPMGQGGWGLQVGGAL
jgi:hypothetical protein